MFKDIFIDACLHGLKIETNDKNLVNFLPDCFYNINIDNTNKQLIIFESLITGFILLCQNADGLISYIALIKGCWMVGWMHGNRYSTDLEKLALYLHGIDQYPLWEKFLTREKKINYVYRECNKKIINLIITENIYYYLTLGKINLLNEIKYHIIGTCLEINNWNNLGFTIKNI